MKIKNGNITCVAEHMNEIVDIMKLQRPEAGDQKPDGYEFRGGARLARRDTNKWFIYGCTAGSPAGRTAIYELRAADKVRQAISDLRVVDMILKTPPALCVNYRCLGDGS